MCINARSYPRSPKPNSNIWNIFIFNNFIYESAGRNSRLRRSANYATLHVLHRCEHDCKLIIIGDAAMSPYQILQPGGSVERCNDEPGDLWLKGMTEFYKHAASINPTPAQHRQWMQSIKIARKLMDDRTYPMTSAGLNAAMKARL